MFKKDRPAAEADPQLAGSTAGALEEGRAFLQSGELSAAVASFRIAQLDRSTAADASNGLGIVYAKLGRLDLAERYFEAAIVSDPENTKFAANLLRLQQQVMLARRGAAGPTLAASEVAPAPRPRDASELLAAGTVERVSRGEVFVSTRSDLGTAPAISVAYASVPAARAEPVDAARTTSETAPPQDPVSIVFGE